jgi:hypothetical protein
MKIYFEFEGKPGCESILVDTWISGEVKITEKEGIPDFLDERGAIETRGDDFKTKIEIVSGGPHEEGYSYTHEVITQYHDFSISCEITTNARDCDGPLDTYSDFVWENGEWVKTDSYQRDAYAENMGY